jgi:ABC-type glycerol-3-phosphate transport system substrate-binding protein
MTDSNGRNRSSERIGGRIHDSRRKFIRATGVVGVAGLAGCTGNDGGNGGGTSGNGDGSESNDGQTVGDVEGSQNQVTIEWMAWPHGPMERLNEVLHQAGMPENITVKRVPGGDNTDDFKSRTQKVLSASRARPDIFHMDSAWILSFMQRDQLVNLTEKLSDSTLNTVKNQYGPKTQVLFGRKNLNESGDLFAIPSLADFPTIVYRKDLAKQAGFDPEGENWSTTSMNWKRFSQVVNKVSSEADTKYGYISNWAQSTLIACCSFNELMTGFGGAYFGDKVFGKVGERPITVAEEPTIRALKLMRTFMYGYDDKHSLPEDSSYAGGISTPSTLQWQLEPERKQFHAGNAAFMRTWPYALPTEYEKWGDKMGTMPIPYGVPKDKAKYGRPAQASNALGGWNNAINPNTDYMEESVAFLEAMAKPEVQLHLLETAGKLPPHKGARQEALNSPDRFPAMGPHMDTLQVAAESAVPYPVSSIWSRQATKVTQQVFGVLNQNKAPKKAMSTLKTQLEQLERTA